MNRKKRLIQGKRWAITYVGNKNKIIYAYVRKFKVSKLCAINDLTSFGINLDQDELDKIRLDCHYDNIQHLPKKKLQEILDRQDYYED